MDLPGTSSSNNSLPFVGKPFQTGKTLIFCNGIMNTLESATASASVISNAFGNRQVFVFHNPTDLNDYFDHDIEQFELQTKLAASLAKEIHNFILADRKRGLNEDKISVVLLVHSHGAIVAERALEALDKTDRTKMSIHAFGGATVIPKRLAYRVHNYVFDEDLIADLGNVTSENMILYQKKQIIRVMNKKELTLQDAIFEQTCIDLHLELFPGSRIGRSEDHQTKTSKDQRYRKIFIQKDTQELVSDPFFTKRIRDYATCFRDYNIIIREGTHFQSPEYSKIKKHSDVGEFLENLPGNLASMIENVFKGLTGLGNHAVTNHQFSAYQPILLDIAKEEFPE